MTFKVSVVIVARNEEDKIADCIRAAHEAVAEIGGAEIIVADSASSDRTASISLQMGAKVLRLRPDWELSASAGRYIGTHYAGGEFLLFVDADTLVYENFVGPALAEFERNEKLAGICGYLDDTTEGTDELLVFEDRHREAADLKWMRGGCCFYRRNAIKAVGSFNPYLLTEEEADMGLRLTRAGWKLRMLPIPMAIHTRCTEDLSGKSIVTHLRRSLFSGRVGGTTRTLGYAIKNGYGFAFCRLRMPTVIFFGLWLALILFLILVPVNFLHVIGFYASFLGFVIILLKKGSLKRTIMFFVAKLMYYVNLVLGISKLKFTRPDRYPLDVEVLTSNAANARAGRTPNGSVYPSSAAPQIGLP